MAAVAEGQQILGTWSCRCRGIRTEECGRLVVVTVRARSLLGDSWSGGEGGDIKGALLYG